jgi:CRP-like cAMP-binding protein
MADEIELIRKIDFFGALEPKIVRKVADVCIPKSYAAGDYMIRQGETGLGLFFVVSGELNVEIERAGHKTVVATLKAEDFVGELSVIDNQPRSASVICVQDTKCLVLTRDSFLRLMNKYPQIAIQMAKSLSERLRTTDDVLHQHKIQAAGASPEETVGASTPPGTEDSSSGPSATESEAGAPATASNGNSKQKVQDFLVDTFTKFYTVKAMTRFSVAVVGCPIELKPDKDSFSESVGEVKLLVLTGPQDHAVSMDATGNGAFSATVLRPCIGESEQSYSRSLFRGEIQEGEKLLLQIPADAKLEPQLSRKS